MEHFVTTIHCMESLLFALGLPVAIFAPVFYVWNPIFLNPGSVTAKHAGN